MSINLKVVTFKGQPPKEPLAITFGRKGGTIGRSENNHLILPDPDRYISRQHAVILHENNSYYFKDTSLSGSYIRNKQILLHQNKMKLEEGDLIEIGDYELLVGGSPIAETKYLPDQIQMSGGTDPIDDLITEPSDMASASMEQFGAEAESVEKKKYGDFEAALDFIDKKMEEVALKQHSEPESDLLFPDEGNGLLPDGDFVPAKMDGEFLDDDASQLDADHPSPENVILLSDEDEVLPIKEKKEAALDSKSNFSAQNPPSYAQLFEIFLEAAGIEDREFYTDGEIPELMKTAGAVFRELVKGLTVLINGRAESKNQLRLAGTIMGPEGNNPFKFSSHMEEIFKLLLQKKQEGFIPGIQAVRESHADIISHQLAMTVGIQAALKKALKRFDPAPYMQRSKKGLFSSEKVKCWDAYCNDYEKIVIKTLENFLDDEFVRAYEAQIERLNGSK